MGQSLTDAPGIRYTISTIKYYSSNSNRGWTEAMKRLNLIAARIKYFGKQQVLADHLPVSRQELSAWENCTATPQSHWRHRLLEELHCNDIEALLRVFEDSIPPRGVATKPTRANT